MSDLSNAFGIDEKMLPQIIFFALTAFFVNNRANAATAGPDPVIPPQITKLDVDEIVVTARNYQVWTMARTAWAEARGVQEDDLRTPLHDGMQAVINVIMNRYKLSLKRPRGLWWGNTPTEICLRRMNGIYQFECWSPSAQVLGRILSVTEADPQFRQALFLASEAWAGRLPDIVRGATHYYAPKKVNASWASKIPKVAQIGNHDFHIELA